jgi:hypothetical protein
MRSTLAGNYLEGEKPWKNVRDIDIAMPCATQNEIDAKDAQALVDAGMKLLVEGANMPTCSDAIELLHEHKIEFGPAKACNAGVLHPEDILSFLERLDLWTAFHTSSGTCHARCTNQSTFKVGTSSPICAPVSKRQQPSVEACKH